VKGDYRIVQTDKEVELSSSRTIMNVHNKQNKGDFLRLTKDGNKHEGKVASITLPRP